MERPGRLGKSVEHYDGPPAVWARSPRSESVPVRVDLYALRIHRITLAQRTTRPRFEKF